MHSNHLTLASCKVIIRIICDPSIPSGMSLDGKVLKEQTAIQFAITLDVIWNLRNQVIHGDHKIKIIATINMLESIIMEHVLSLLLSRIMLMLPSLWINLLLQQLQEITREN